MQHRDSTSFNIVECNMLNLNATMLHHAASCCIMLYDVERSLISIEHFMQYRSTFLLFCFSTAKNGRSSPPSGQSGCGGADDRKRRYVVIYHSSRDVCTPVLNSFSIFNTIIPGRTKEKSLIPLSNFKFSCPRFC